MTSHGGGSRLWYAWASLLLAFISAVIFVLLASGERSASAQVPPDPIARAWGINSFGQLGDDSFAPRSKQVAVKGEGGVGSLGDVTSLDGGQNHTVALKDGTAYAWGHNGSGQLGTGPLSGTGANSDLPVKVHGAGDVGFLTDVLAVAAGGNFSLALVSDGTGDGVPNDGDVYAWGDNFQGQLGNNSPASSNVPVQVHGAGDVGFLTDVVDIAAGSAHGLAVKSDGTVWAWGYDGFGQLGDSASHAGNLSRLPVQVEGVGGTGFLSGVSSVAGGGLHSLALKTDGSVYAWGYNGTGGLGNGGGPDSSTPVQVKGEGGSGSLSSVTDIAAGSEHSLALKDGTVYAWGLNNFRQLGDDTSVFQRNAPVKVKGEGGVGFLTGATDVAAGAHHSLAAVSANGTVWAWGRNDLNSLGDGTSTTPRPTPVQSIQLIGTTKLASGDFHSLAVADADITPPDTTIDPNSLPPANSVSNSASFKLDADPFASCSSPKNYSGLSEGSHTFHVRARDIAGNVDSSPASHTWTVDTVDPSGTVEINGGDASTNDAAVNLTLSADDPSPGTGVAEMSFSNDGTTWSVPEPFATSKSWILASGDGEKTVHVRYKDAAGNEATAQDTIELDTAAPSVETWLPKGKKVSPRVKPTVTFSEEMDETSVEASTDGKPTTFILKKGIKVIPATVAYTESGTTFKAVLTPTKPLKRGTTYTATVTTAATDAAGNAVATKTWKFTVRS
jgi:alpha-tubulin suppressor-like RCC1 family protein